MSGATKSMLLAGGLVGGVVGLSDFAAARGADDYRARQSITIPPLSLARADGSHSLSKRMVAPEAVIWR